MSKKKYKQFWISRDEHTRHENTIIVWPEKSTKPKNLYAELSICYWYTKCDKFSEKEHTLEGFTEKYGLELPRKGTCELYDIEI